MKKANFSIPIISIAFLFLIFTNQNLYTQTGWFLQESGQSYWYLNSVCFINSNTGFAAGNNGTLSKTTNAGLNWTLQNTGTNNDFKSICFPSQNTGYIVGSGGVLVKTTDGAATWNLYPAGTNNLQTSMFFFNEYTGFVSAYYLFNNIHYSTNSAEAQVFKTTDGGFNWVSFNIGLGSINSLFFINTSTGFASGDYIDGNYNYYGIMYKTTNGGMNWVINNSYYAYNSYYYRTWFCNLLTGFVLGASTTPTLNGFIYKTTDCGNTWNITALGSLYPSSLYFIGLDTGYIVGSSGIIFKTINSGNNWESQQDLATSSWLYDVWFSNSNTGYAVGSNGTIIKTTTGGNPVGINPISKDIPTSFSLSQNYPNPFNPSTKIKFDIPNISPPFTGHPLGQGGFVTLRIYDILGREVTTLVNEKLQPGTYEVEWNGSNYPSGVYFYRINVTDPETSLGLGFQTTKKMILIK